MRTTHFKETVLRALRQPTGRTLLRLAASRGLVFDQLNRLAGSHGIFNSFSDAWRSARSEQANGHEEPTLNQNHLRLPLRQSDYPVLFWLHKLQPAHVLDFGGSVGNMYRLYCGHLSEPPADRWTVYDLPDVVARGRASFTEELNGRVHFTSELAGLGCGVDLLLASGSLHYWERPLAELFSQLASRPAHVIINRSPLTERARPYVVLQRSPHAAFPCVVRKRSEFLREWKELGYELVSEWSEPRSVLQLPLFPAHSVNGFSCFYFRRES